jgi:hypothetical protein
MSKAGSSLLRTTLVRAANTVRTQDPQLARMYHQQMTRRGKVVPSGFVRHVFLRPLPRSRR